MFNILEVHGGETGLELQHAFHFYICTKGHDKQARIYEQHGWQPLNVMPSYI